MSKKTPEQLEAAIRKYHIDREPITMRQLKLALLDAELLGDVDTAIASFESPEKDRIQIEWENSTSVKRHDDWLVSLTEALGLDGAAVDELYYKALSL